MIRHGKKWFAGVAVALTAGGLSMGLAPLAPLANAAPTIGATTIAYGHGSTAAWNKPGSAVTLVASKAKGASAQVELVKPPQPSAKSAPTMTASSVTSGSPRWVIQFHNGASLYGTPGSGHSLTWTLQPGNKPESTWGGALAAAHASGKDNQVTAAFVVNYAVGTAVTVSHLTYNGAAVVRYVRPYLYDGHVITVNNNRAQIGWKDGPGVHYVLTRTFGYGFSKNGSPQIGFTGITTGYWGGLAAGHTYDMELIPASANRQPLPNAQVGWINIVTTR